MKQHEIEDSRHRIDRIARIAQRWRRASATIQNRLPEFRVELARQDRLMRLVLVAYGRDIGRMQSVEGRMATSQADLAQIADHLVTLDQKAAALRDSVARVLALNARLELQLKQERVEAKRLDQARRAALSWSDTLRAELDRKSEALREATAQLAAKGPDVVQPGFKS